ncbi:preprotein translocase subunit SecE [Methylobacterium nodulans]|uniref:Protein translocase subunit SecE n=1 Tax=Methylobacterium nodulans (strain LMG 21967 / CNCM I-2342 / ORS 2060) TaxID=460265 RepID=B8IS70_METNO|nr:preprotein translocase subunit SecE [Methylobacterium nodulans]ACL56882.1 preprotein translocase, SecE subunit [Methylobacterium nodulans ORS 2060]
MASNEATKKVDLGRNAARGTPAPRGSGGGAPTPPARPTQKRVGPFEFLQQVRDEGRKVTWPTRKETLITTLMVFVMVVLASLFFVVVDQVLRYLVTLVLGIGA